MPSNAKNYTCPVCGYDELDEPPYLQDRCPSFDICRCCGTEFGYDDAGTPHLELRAQWWRRGCDWFRPEYKPSGWTAEEQLRRAGLPKPQLAPVAPEQN